ncbi:MAG TPA: hypothetical protein VGG92_02420, partial [Caulobacteraceae bacterium]
MLDVMNRLAHGYVASPVLLACEVHGLFAALEADDGRSQHELAVALRANPGHLQVALRTLETLGWVRRDGDRFGLGQGSADRRRLPRDLGALYAADRPALAGPDAAELRPWLARALRDWDVATASTAQLLDGALLMPLLLELQACDDQLALIDRLDPESRADLIALLTARGWLERADAPAWTSAGAALLDRIYGCATVASYRPMLNQMDALIFGDCDAVFQRRADGSEGHVDRILNVLGSGFQHKRYFDEACSAIREAFAYEPLDAQPRYIMDIGCGDGALLKAAYETVLAGTSRGQALDRFPLTLIAVDLNAQALAETARTLDGLPHILVAGDIDEPAEILHKLREQGVEDPDAILHVRSFLDHDRPFRGPDREVQPVGASRAVSVAADGGLIPPDDAMQSLAELFERWAAVIGRHGLVALEVHALDPDVAGRFSAEAESIHFDAYHGFS